MLQKTLINFIWALPGGSGFTLQVLIPAGHSGLFTAIPNAKKK
jgi:hypothetical protein